MINKSDNALAEEKANQIQSRLNILNNDLQDAEGTDYYLYKAFLSDEGVTQALKDKIQIDLTNLDTVRTKLQVAIDAN